MKKFVSLICLIVIVFYTMAPSFAELTKRDFTITRNNVELKSIIASKYDGYEFTMKNHTKKKLLVTNFVVDNGVTSQIAYANVKRNGWAAAGVTFVYGWNYALSTLGMSLVGAVVAWPFFVGASMFGNLGARMEANRFNEDTLTDGFFKKKEIVKFKVFAPQGVLPAITIVLEDEDGQNYAYTHSYFGTEFQELGHAKSENLKEKIVEIQAKSAKVEEEDGVAQKEQVESGDMRNDIKNAFENKKVAPQQETKSVEEQFEQGANTTADSEKPTETQVPEAYKMYNTGVTLDPNVKTKQPFEGDKNFTSF